MPKVVTHHYPYMKSKTEAVVQAKGDSPGYRITGVKRSGDGWTVTMLETGSRVIRASSETGYGSPQGLSFNPDKKRRK